MENPEEPCAICKKLTLHRTLANANPVCPNCAAINGYLVKIPNWVMLQSQETG